MNRKREKKCIQSDQPPWNPGGTSATPQSRKVPVFDCAVALCTMQNALLVISNLTWLDLLDLTLRSCTMNHNHDKRLLCLRSCPLHSTKQSIGDWEIGNFIFETTTKYVSVHKPNNCQVESIITDNAFCEYREYRAYSAVGAGQVQFCRPVGLPLLIYFPISLVPVAVDTPLLHSCDSEKMSVVFIKLTRVQCCVGWISMSRLFRQSRKTRR
jgi:hypothetical protein